MHCQSCDILVKDKFREFSNIRDVQADYRTGKVLVSYVGHLNKEALNEAICKYGYTVAENDAVQVVKAPFSTRITEASVIGMILFVLYFMAQDLNLIPSMAATTQLNYGAAFILGLIASTSTCMATSGALFMATVGKLRKGSATFTENIVPAVSFNVGRVLSYGAFGFVIGMIGKTFVTNLALGSYLTLFVSIAMILVALDMLQIFSFTSLMPQSFTKGIFEKLETKLIARPKQTAFLLGAITYLLPCGFTQSVQLFALSLGNPVQSALLMMSFAIGTVPALLAVGSITSFTKSQWYPMFAKVMAMVIFLVGSSYFFNFLSLQGVSLPKFGDSTSSTNVLSAQQAADPKVTIEDGKQVVKMDVSAQGYSPDSFTVKAGVPVKWMVNGVNVLGCQGTLLAPKANIQQALQSGNNVIEFTPSEKGPLNFSCSMGMFRGSFNVI